MRILAALVLLLFSTILLAQVTTSTGNAGAFGGNITPLNLSMNQTSDRWFFFYGNATSNTSANSTLTLNSSILFDSTDNTRLLYFQSTYIQYIISDSSFPFNGSFASPDLNAFNSHFNLSGASDVTYLFNITHNFSVIAPGDSSPSNLTLPAVDLLGYASNGSVQPYYEGISQTNSSFVFLVPVSHQAGFDNRTFDYEFVLPYNLVSSNTFYVFSQVGGSNTSTSSGSSAPTGGSGPPSINYRWSYSNITGLTIWAPPGSIIILHDALGQVYNLVANSNGLVNLAGLPPGTYSLKIEAPGYQTVLDTLYIPTSTPIPLPPSLPSPTNSSLVTFEQTPQGTAMCIGSDCYLVPNASISGLQKLSELSCTGSICHLVGINEEMFALKYNLKPTGTVVYPQQLAPPPAPPDLSGMLSSIGPALSAEFGGTGAASNGPVFIAAAVVLAAAGAAVVSLLRPPPIRGGGRRRGGGYG